MNILLADVPPPYVHIFKGASSAPNVRTAWDFTADAGRDEQETSLYHDVGASVVSSAGAGSTHAAGDGRAPDAVFVKLPPPPPVGSSAWPSSQVEQNAGASSVNHFDGTTSAVPLLLLPNAHAVAETDTDSHLDRSAETYWLNAGRTQMGVWADPRLLSRSRNSPRAFLR